MQAVIAVAKGKWGGVEALEKHQSNKLRLVLQRQEAERQRDEARAASKRPRTDYEAQFQDWQDSEDYRFDGYGNMHSKRRHTSYEDWHYDEWLKQETGYSEQAVSFK